MGWYDFFSRFYDGSLEAHYADARKTALEALRVEPGARVLDLPTGTGQSLDLLAAAAGTSGRVVGVDLSTGMLARARARTEAAGWSQVNLVEADVLGLAELELPVSAFDRVHVFLGLTAFPEWERAFELIWDRLEPGGRAVVVDVYAERLRFQGRMVNLVARADIQRRAWEPLEAVARDFERTLLPPNPKYGGDLWCASGTKPA